MCDPIVRIRLIYLALYGRDVQRLLSFTQNDSLGIAAKAPRVIRTRIAYLQQMASDSNDHLAHPDLDDLREFVEARAATYTDLDVVRERVREMAAEAAKYFQGKDGADSAPQDQRALRWLNHPALLVLGLLDEKQHAVTTAKALTDMAKQGSRGIARAMPARLLRLMLNRFQNGVHAVRLQGQSGTL